MKFCGKEIKNLTDEQLVQSNDAVQKLEEDYLSKTNNEKFIKKFENKYLPKINPAFQELKSEILNEILKRKIKNV